MKRAELNYDRSNTEAARIILSDPESYEGIQLEWAQMWIQRNKTAFKSLWQKPRLDPPSQRVQQSLFELS